MKIRKNRSKRSSMQQNKETKVNVDWIGYVQLIG